MSDTPSQLSTAKQQQEFEAFARELLDQQPVSDALQLKLAQARSKALEQHVTHSRTWPWAVAACLVCAIGVFSVFKANVDSTEVAYPLIAELGENDVEMELVNDLEFYQWLSELEG